MPVAPAPVRRCPRWCWWVWWSGALLLAGVWCWPINAASSRWSLAGLCLALWGSLLLATWPHRIWRRLLLGVAVVVLLGSLAPGRLAPPSRLQAVYVERLRAYTGTRYLWGGENWLGIDCSGLVRRGLIDAYARMALAGPSPSAWRRAVWLWCHDCSAKALGDGHGGLTVPICQAPSLNALAGDLRLAPGDLAVTGGGVHVLAYLGEGRWIQAEPGVGRVVSDTVPSADPWYRMPVRVVRWRELSHSPSGAAP